MICVDACDALSREIQPHAQERGDLVGFIWGLRTRVADGQPHNASYLSHVSYGRGTSSPTDSSYVTEHVGTLT